MPYIGNDIRANVDYKTIDDISGSFNGSTTSFALQVGGVAPTPFPKYETQLIISVGGVIQEPDSSGSAGFQLSGTNIVFSSAPAAGEAFFGVLLASADYLNAGGTFPDGTVAVPSITFTEDTDTGFTRISSGAVAVTSNGTKIAQFPTSQGSSGQALTTDGAGVLSFSTIVGGATGVDFNDNVKARFGTGNDLEIYHDSTHSYIQDVGTGHLLIGSSLTHITNAAGNENCAKFTENGAVELFHDNSKKFDTSSVGVNVEGQIIIDHTGGTDGKGEIAFGESGRPFIDGFDNGNHGSGAGFDFRAGNGDYFIKTRQDAAVELYHDNSKKLETTSGGINVTGGITVNGSAFSSGKILQVVHQKITNAFSYNGTSYGNVGISANITPSATSSKILVIFNINAGSNNNGNRIKLRVSRTGDDNEFVGDASGSRTRASAMFAVSSASDCRNTTISYVSSPNTTSQVGYTLQAALQVGGGSNVTFGASATDTNASLEGRCPQHITLIEIAG